MAGMSELSAGPMELLVARGRGEAEAFERLVPLVHHELPRLARRHVGRKRPGNTLQATALVKSLSAVDRSETGAVAEPRALLRLAGARDAAHPGGLRARPRQGQAERRSAKGEAESFGDA
jgi:hypothetical protein